MIIQPLVFSSIVFGSNACFDWSRHGSDVIRNDPERNIYIPDELIMPLQVMASYIDSAIFFRYY